MNGVFATSVALVLGQHFPSPWVGGFTDECRVTVFSDAETEELNARLLAEMRSQGFDPTSIAKTDANQDSDIFVAMERASEAAETSLAIRLKVGSSMLRLWIVNRVTGEHVYRETKRDPDANVDASIASLWAVEALRASFGEHGFESERPRWSEEEASRKPDPQARNPAREQSRASSSKEHDWSAQIAPAALWSPGGLDASLPAFVGVIWRPHSTVGAEVAVAIPLMPSHLRGASGEARVFRGLAMGGARWLFAGSDSEWSASGALGIALGLTRTVGTGRDGFEGRADEALSSGPYMRFSAHREVTSHLRLWAGVSAGLLFPPPAIYLGERSAASVENPWLLGALGAEVLF